MTFITATTLPLLIALAEIGQRDGVMLPATSAALVGAGVLSVLVYPLIAVTLHRSARISPVDAGIEAAGTVLAAGTVIAADAAIAADAGTAADAATAADPPPADNPGPAWPG